MYATQQDLGLMPDLNVDFSTVFGVYLGVWIVFNAIPELIKVFIDPSQKQVESSTAYFIIRMVVGFVPFIGGLFAVLLWLWSVGEMFGMLMGRGKRDE